MGSNEGNGIQWYDSKLMNENVLFLLDFFKPELWARDIKLTKTNMVFEFSIQRIAKIDHKMDKFESIPPPPPNKKVTKMISNADHQDNDDGLQ